MSNTRLAPLNSTSYAISDYGNNAKVFDKSGNTRFLNLTDCKLEGVLYRSVSISRASQLDKASVVSWIDALYNWTEDLEGKASLSYEEINGLGHTLTLHENHKALFSGLAVDGNGDAILWPEFEIDPDTGEYALDANDEPIPTGTFYQPTELEVLTDDAAKKGWTIE